MNNADFGMTVQSTICDIFDLTPCKKAREQFSSSYNKSYRPKIEPIIKEVFKRLGSKPIGCTTFEKSDKKGEMFLPYNFVLENGKTLSIRTSKSNKMVAPRVVGQAGYNVLNLFFEDIIGKPLEDQSQIRSAIVKHIHEMLPVFVSYLFNSDFTVWINAKYEKYDFIIVDSNSDLDIEYEPEHFSFTKSLADWTESNTLKYKNMSIAEIQTHSKRSFKFRFNFPNLIKLLIEKKRTTETVGISAEYAICKKFGIKYPKNLEERKSDEVVSELSEAIDEAFAKLPKPIKYTGSDRGERLGNSKCSYDFLLEGNKTLSLKTNTYKMVCPPEVGQPNASTFSIYFADITKGALIDEVFFKNLVLNSADKMLPVYTKHLFDSDYLLWVFKRNEKWTYKILEKDAGNNIEWTKEDISFTKRTVEEWNESNTIKFKKRTIGEFQVHHHRNCFKFRFDFDYLVALIEENYPDKD